MCARIEIGVELEIVKTGNPVLRQQARPLTPAEIAGKEIQKLIESMRKTMYDAPGVGLAAPQVGLALQLAVIEDREEYHKEVPAEQLRERERRPVGFYALFPRARTVRVEFLNERGMKETLEASGWHARILQHEIDHLRGTLYIDRMHPRTFTSLDNWNQFWKGKPISEIKTLAGSTLHSE